MGLLGGGRCGDVTVGKRLFGDVCGVFGVIDGEPETAETRGEMGRPVNRARRCPKWKAGVPWPSPPNSKQVQLKSDKSVIYSASP